MEQDLLSKYSHSRSLLDSKGYISLGNILATYDAPINEDHAWALCYLSGKYLESHSLLSTSTSTSSHVYGLVPKQKTPDAELIKIHHEDGHVALDLDIIKREDSSCFLEFDEHGTVGGKRILSVTELISKIALIIYKALDFGMKEDEERSLSFPMESMLDKMILSENQETDENNNNDALKENDNVIRACLLHFSSIGFSSSSSGQITADSFYRQICKDLVSETLEFSKFLSVAERATKNLQYFRETSGGGGGGDLSRFHLPVENSSFLNVKNDLKAVAKRWIQVVRELRSGVALKRLDKPGTMHQRPRHEYNKTPYEQLMDDIRSQKYKLRKVPEHIAARSKLKMGIHDIIMEYVRSRPKLRKVSERILRPATSKRSDPYEELMKSIKQDHHLRPVAKTS